MDIGAFVNDMNTLCSKEDLLSLLVYLGYWGYDRDTEDVYISNREVKEAFLQFKKESE